MLLELTRWGSEQLWFLICLLRWRPPIERKEWPLLWSLIKHDHGKGLRALIHFSVKTQQSKFKLKKILLIYAYHTSSTSCKGASYKTGEYDYWVLIAQYLHYIICTMNRNGEMNGLGNKEDGKLSRWQDKILPP